MVAVNRVEAIMAACNLHGVRDTNMKLTIWERVLRTKLEVTYSAPPPKECPIPTMGPDTSSVFSVVRISREISGQKAVFSLPDVVSDLVC